MILWLQYAACKASAVLFGFVAKASEKPIMSHSLYWINEYM